MTIVISRQRTFLIAIPVVIAAGLLMVAEYPLIGSAPDPESARNCAVASTSAPSSDVAQAGRVRNGAAAGDVQTPDAGGRARVPTGAASSGDAPVNYVRCRNSES